MEKYPLNLRDNAATREKWDEFGRARRHYGSTFVCDVTTDSPLYRLGIRIQDEVTSREIDHHYGLVPPSSFHMTVAEGLKRPGYVNQFDKWPAHLGDMPFTEAVAVMREQLVEASIPAPHPFEMKTTGVDKLEDSLTVLLQPADKDSELALAQFRHRVYDTLGIQVEDPDSYQFHMTLGYRLTEPNPEEEGLGELYQLFDSWARDITTVDLEPVGFCVFADMYSFPQILTFI